MNEIVEAMRDCVYNTNCDRCAFVSVIDDDDCKENMMLRASDLLEQFEMDKQILIYDNALKQKEIDQLKANQPVKGEWEEDGIFQRCSKCHSNFATEDSDGDELIFVFCPNCGADMRGEKDERD